jgi:DNA-binding LytR/AlgR family response regulator
VKVEILIRQDLDEPYVVVYTNEITESIQDMVDTIGNTNNKKLTGIKDQKIFILNHDDIYCFYSENQRIYAKTDNGSLWIKYKLYHLEEMFKGSSFVRISNSCIANVDKIKNLDISFNGTIALKFKNGDTEFVSRRYVSKIKKYLGI